MLLRKFSSHVGFSLVALTLAAGMTAIAFYQWKRKQPADSAKADEKPVKKIQDGTTPARVGAEARKNLNLVSKPAQLTTYHRKIDIPAVITDRPGVSDRGVVAPVTGIVTEIHAHPGKLIAPAASLFTLRLVSEALHATQLELFKATKEIDIARQQKQRLEGLAASGGLAGSRIIDIDNQMERMAVNVQAYRQALIARGLPLESIEAAAKGNFVTEITVRAPEETSAEPSSFQFEFQSLKVELGQQVDAGAVLCILADYRQLLIEGRGFKKDMPLIQEAAKEQFPIEMALDGDDGKGWPALPKDLSIEHVANLIDPASRTFAFYLPLANQQQSYSHDDHSHTVWRFRPGDRVRLSIGVQELKDVFVLPQAAVVRDGPEAYVFRQNGDLFDRIAVHVKHEDAASIVIANDGKLRKGAYLAQNAAASLNRVLKSQLASGQPTNVHVHPDGATHAAH